MYWEHTYLYNLKSQRRFLIIFTMLEIITAISIIIIEIANYFANQRDFMMRRIHFEQTQLDKIIDQFNSSVFIDYLWFFIYPFLCLVIQIALFVYARRNAPDRVTGRECAWVILITVQIPTLWGLFADSNLDEDIARYCIVFSFFLINILLIRNLRQYTQSIRKEKAREASEAPEPQ